MFKILFLSLVILGISSCETEEQTLPDSLDSTVDETEILYTMPEESEPHEGTWLQWPHHHQYGRSYPKYLDNAWIQMTKELIESEKVHIVAYDETEKNRIIDLLTQENISLTNIDFKIYPNDDFWVRDNGAIYVRDQNGNLVIEDWGFNAWGKKANYQKCDIIPSKIANDQNRTLIDLNQIMINEGGAIEVDGHGALLATKSAILNENRNPNMTQTQAETIFKKYLGVTHFIWLDGKIGSDITDQHIDGFARFLDSTTIITMNSSDLLDFDIKQSDIDKLYNSKTKYNKPYKFIKLPLTKNNVTTTYDKSIGYKGSYINYYIANTKILVPNYNDPHDSVANSILQQLYPNRTVIGIDARNMYIHGGMIHCVTQQQPQE